MRALIVSDQADRREALAAELGRAGHAVAGTTDVDGVMHATRSTAEGPDLLVIDAVEDTADLRRLIERARGAAEDPERPVLVIVPNYSPWLRGLIPADLHSVVAVASTLPLAEVAAAAIAKMRGDDAAGPAGAPLSYDDERREVSGSGGTVRLTHSESALLAELIREGRGAVTHDRIAQALWGRAFADRYGRASIRSHMHTLRRKLDSIGLAEAVSSVPGVGYRLTIDGVLLAA